jgi:hypothetical protein
MKAPEACTLEMPGLEADNLLAFLATLGLLRSLETSHPDWLPRVSWRGPPWKARLHLAQEANEAAVAAAAAEGVLRLVEQFDTDGRDNVNFKQNGFRTFAERVASRPVASALAAALSTEWPVKDDEKTHAAPLVMLFGQGHQNFLQRLVSVPRGDLPGPLHKRKNPPDLRSPAMIADALFRPWKRVDETDAFRWDPEEDQRYALRFGDPSRAGAAPTVHGANRLAAIGLLSFPCMPTNRRARAAGSTRSKEGVLFMWPIWTSALTRQAIEDLLVHPDLIHRNPEALVPFGVKEVLCARRVSNGKFMNVTRASPVAHLAESQENTGRRRS